MKVLFATATLGLALLAFAGTEKKVLPVSCEPSNVSTYQDTIPRKDTSRKRDKDRKDKKERKERRDTMYQYHL